MERKTTAGETCSAMMLQTRHHCRILRHDLFVLFLLCTVPLSYSSRTTFDYGDALSKSLLYFESQRSGRLPYSQRATWRSDSGLHDGLQQGVDLVGGYYDAGDNVKFGLPMAFTVTMLSWGVIEYRQEITDAGELRHALEAIKWGTDYFIKAHTHPNVLWAQVGDGYTDHYCWQRPEDMTTSRQAYKVDKDNPGSEIAGETAAAMAAASIVFRKTNPHYSHLLLHHAKQLFEFGEKYRGNYDESVGVAKGYYPSVSGYGDELLWAALWLYRATTTYTDTDTDSNTTTMPPKKKMSDIRRNNNFYFNYVLENGMSLGGITWAMSEFSWDVKYSGLQLIASMLLKEANYDDQQRRVLEDYRSKGEHYICACLNLNPDNTTNVRRTPGGLLYTRQWNNMQYVSNAAFLLTVYGDHLKSTNEMLTCGGGDNHVTVHPQDILDFAKSQVDYILGDNPMGTSYLVGFGSKYPLRVHHRGGSTESYRNNRGFIGCTQGYDNWYGRKKPNPNVVTGALVGGPDESDRFRDDRGNYVQTEACTYNTATLVGVFARLRGLEGKRILSGTLVASS